MKHSLPVTLFLVGVFFVSQLVGLLFINADISSINTVLVDGQEQVVVVHDPATQELRPPTKGFGSLAYLGVGIIIGTLLILLLIKLRAQVVWKAWFFLAVLFTITFALRTIFEVWIAFLIALVLAVGKLYRPNIVTHNLAEMFMYSGIAVLLVPVFDLFWASLLLVLISVYDAYAVWRSKHMVGMATFMTQSNAFAGLAVPATKTRKEKMKSVKVISSTKNVSKVPSAPKNKGQRLAILGGGDVAFPLIFSGVVMENLLLQGATRITAFMQASIISVTTAFVLFLLFKYGKPGKFYPAMPFLTVGCFIGLAITLLF